MKKNKLLFYLALILVSFTGCIDRRDCCDMVISQEFYVNLQNSEANNLLDPQTEGSVDISKIRLFLIENGEAKMYRVEGGGILDNPFGIAPVEINGILNAKFQFQYNGKNKEIKGFIQWNESLVDTLNFTFNSANNPSLIIRISQNGQTLWDKETDQLNPVIIKLTQ
ncbi:hypothetical protein [Algoriphagus sp.]|uniref:hypothetical protein n=1 Tax=Algoriphagus sp. TaxID=1872435 RepID=UPI00271DC8E9|nr:hypothetical protein [Algoriphagus sp.]MDO8965343.1 hypothetical protein [Algoriphagus sp.]MDP3198775.1 hypothetical protein [Algoriphagus sp.]